jgi:hypothetical protein
MQLENKIDKNRATSSDQWHPVSRAEHSQELLLDQQAHELSPWAADRTEEKLKWRATESPGLTAEKTRDAWLELQN